MIRSRVKSLFASAVVAALAVTGVGVVVSTPAWAAAGVTVTSDLGAGVVDPDYATNITVSGSGFQSIRNGFGGVYVLFGWVDDPSGGSWRPSNGGTVGADFRYVPDSESKDNAGYQRFVSFPGSSTEGAAQAVFADDGSFTLAMTVPGAVFESQDREGNVSEVNCLEVTCGIITIGAHGVKNANNETFTPLTFRSAETGAAAADESESSTTDVAAGAAIAAPADSSAATQARLGLASTEITAGNAIVFTGRGFTVGEQVVADLDNGVTAVGPLIAGAAGEVAGSLPVPTDLADGTHVVTLRGAASGVVVTAELTTKGGSSGLAVAQTEEGTPAWVLIVLLICILIALILVVVSVSSSISRARRKRKAEKASGAAPTKNKGAKKQPKRSTADVVPVPAAESAPETEALPAVEDAGQPEDSVAADAAGYTRAVTVQEADLVAANAQPGAEGDAK